MRVGKKRKYNVDQIESFFALFPVTIDGETRWLEKVKIRGRWKHGLIFGYYERFNFIDD